MSALYHHVPAFEIDCTTCTSFVTYVWDSVCIVISIDAADQMQKMMFKINNHGHYRWVEHCTEIYKVLETMT